MEGDYKLVLKISNVRDYDLNYDRDYGVELHTSIKDFKGNKDSTSGLDPLTEDLRNSVKEKEWCDLKIASNIPICIYDRLKMVRGIYKVPMNVNWPEVEKERVISNLIKSVRGKKESSWDYLVYKIKRWLHGK